MAGLIHLQTLGKPVVQAVQEIYALMQIHKLVLPALLENILMLVLWFVSLVAQDSVSQLTIHRRMYFSMPATQLH